MPMLELMMLVFFGCSWPVSLYKSYTSRSTKGKSGLFSVLLIVGYGFGITNKAVNGWDYVSYFYILNALMIGADLGLWFRNRRYERAEAAAAQ